MKPLFQTFSLFSSQLGMIFMLSFIENSPLTGVKHNLKSRPSFKKLEIG